MKKKIKEQITLNSEKIKKREQRIKILKITILLILLFLIILYFILRVVFELGDFTVSLDPQLQEKSGLVMYEKLSEKQNKKILKAEKLEYMDNICVKWLPENLTDAEGSHNGENYLAYTFYVENMGNMVANYWSDVVIKDVIKNVDDAVRVRIYRNGEPVTYAKLAANGQPEPDTVAFESDNIVARSFVENFMPGDIDRYTILLWLEGNDPECTDNILGGEFKIEMNFNSEHVDY